MSRNTVQPPITLPVFSPIPLTKQNVLEMLSTIKEISETPAASFMCYLNEMLKDSDRLPFIGDACDFIYKQPAESVPQGFFDFIVRIAKINNDILKNSLRSLDKNHLCVKYYNSARVLHQACVNIDREIASAAREAAKTADKCNVTCCGTTLFKPATNTTALENLRQERSVLQNALELLRNDRAANEIEKSALLTLKNKTSEQDMLHKALGFVLYDKRTQHHVNNPLTAAAAVPIAPRQ